jgi:hypothetical protein
MRDAKDFDRIRGQLAQDEKFELNSGDGGPVQVVCVRYAKVRVVALGIGLIS